MKTSGDRFEVFKRGNRWYWNLEGAYFPSGPIAQSGRGYTSLQAAVMSIKSARSAAAGSSEEPVLLEGPPYLTKESA
jgi:hypothetical protein